MVWYSMVMGRSRQPNCDPEVWDWRLKRCTTTTTLHSTEKHKHKLLWIAYASERNHVRVTVAVEVYTYITCLGPLAQ